MVERIVELANALKNKTGDANAVREELKSIIIPKVMRINELCKKVDLKVRFFDIDGFGGSVEVKTDYDLDGSPLDSKSVILECYDEEYDEIRHTYVDLEYFGKSDEELFEHFKKESIDLKKFMIGLKSRQLDSEIVSLKERIEEIKNLEL